MLSRTTSLRSSPASRLPLAILDIATCRLIENQQQKRLKQKKCCTGFFSFFKVNDSSRSCSDWQFLLLQSNQRFTKVKCVSEHLAKMKSFTSLGSPTKNPDCYSPSGSNSKYASVVNVFALYRIFRASHVLFPMRRNQTPKSNAIGLISVEVHLTLILRINEQIPNNDAINRLEKFVSD